MTMRRPYESLFSAFTIGFGLWIILPSIAMTSSGYVGVLSIADEYQWGLLFLFSGLAHQVSILINGSRWWTPLARAWASMTAFSAYGAWAYGFWLASPTSTAVYSYSVLSAAALWCWYQAMRDCGALYAKRRRRNA